MGVPGKVHTATAAPQSSGARQQLTILSFPCQGHESASMAAAPSFSPSNKTDGWMGGVLEEMLKQNEMRKTETKLSGRLRERCSA